MAKSSNTSLATVITGTGGGLAKNGTGTLNLTGANTYTGPTTVTGGRCGQRQHHQQCDGG